MVIHLQWTAKICTKALKCLDEASLFIQVQAYNSWYVHTHRLRYVHMSLRQDASIFSLDAWYLLSSSLDALGNMPFDILLVLISLFPCMVGFGSSRPGRGTLLEVFHLLVKQPKCFFRLPTSFMIGQAFPFHLTRYSRQGQTSTWYRDGHSCGRECFSRTIRSCKRLSTSLS